MVKKFKWPKRSSLLLLFMENHLAQVFYFQPCFVTIFVIFYHCSLLAHYTSLTNNNIFCLATIAHCYVWIPNDLCLVPTINFFIKNMMIMIHSSTYCNCSRIIHSKIKLKVCDISFDGHYGDLLSLILASRSCREKILSSFWIDQISILLWTMLGSW
jgi:hypothetical protein